jgi:hypothetical protein
LNARATGWVPGSGNVIATRKLQVPDTGFVVADGYGEGSGSYTDTFEIVANP